MDKSQLHPLDDGPYSIFWQARDIYYLAEIIDKFSCEIPGITAENSSTFLNFTPPMILLFTLVAKSRPSPSIPHLHPFELTLVWKFGKWYFFEHPFVSLAPGALILIQYLMSLVILSCITGSSQHLEKSYTQIVTCTYIKIVHINSSWLLLLTSLFTASSFLSSIFLWRMHLLKTPAAINLLMKNSLY